MFELLITMIERLGIIVTIAFVLTRFPFFRDMIKRDRLDTEQQYKAAIFFGFFGIIGTYTGMALNTDTQQFNRWASTLTVDEAIANSRVIGVVLAGLLGGYRVGIGAGIIAGAHRFTLGGFTGIACGLAAMLAGLIAGYFHKKNQHIPLSTAFFVGALAETMQMIIILLLSRPFEKALLLVEIIGVPMIIANGLGSALFLLIIKTVISEEEKAGAVQAQKSLRIADKTLAHLRRGMTPETAAIVCGILYKEIQPQAVAVTNKQEILAHVGLGSDHHQQGIPIQTQITKDVIFHGQLVIATDKTIYCQHTNCPLGAAVIAPLKQRDVTIGTLKFYFSSEKEITNIVIELVSGLSMLLSNQLELAEAEKAYQLAQEAEIKALQAQISPHFLFNSLNTILSLTRIDPDKARKLLISLSHFLRQNLRTTTESFITLEQELKHTQAYLEIEETRFADRLKVIYNIDSSALSYQLPPLTLQPIVENALKHGLKDKGSDCIIEISIIEKNDQTTITVKDNGSGMTEGRAMMLGHRKVDSVSGTGVALYNIQRRLQLMYGDEARLTIKANLHKGTEIAFTIRK